MDWFLLTYLAAVTGALVRHELAARGLTATQARLAAMQAQLDKAAVDQQVANMHRFNDLVRQLRELGVQAGWGDDLQRTQQFDRLQIEILRKKTGPTSIPAPPAAEVAALREPMSRAAMMLDELGWLGWLVVVFCALAGAALALAITIKTGAPR